MCRGTFEGGRRCPCDTSAARQQRRLKNKGSVAVTKQPASAASAAGNSPTTGADDVDTVVTVETVQALVQQFRNLPQPTNPDRTAARAWNQNNIEELLTDEDKEEYAHILKDADGWEMFPVQQRASQRQEERALDLTLQIGEGVDALAAQRGVPTTPDELKQQIAAALGTELVELVASRTEVEKITNALFEDIVKLARDAAPGEFQDNETDTPLALFVIKDKAIGDTDTDRLDALRSVSYRTWDIGRWEPKTDEGKQTRTAILDKIRELQGSLEVEKSRIKKIDTLMGSTTNEILASRGDVYRDILTETTGRTFGGKLDFVTKKDKKKLAETMAAASSYFPEEWVNVSNEAQAKKQLVVKTSQGRAHYSERSPQRERRHIQDKVSADSWRANANYLAKELRDTELIKPGEEGYDDVLERIRVYEYGHNMRHSSRLLSGVQGQLDSGATTITVPKPRGRGWEEVKFTDDEGRAWQTWRKPETTLTTTGVVPAAELTVTHHGNAESKPWGFNTAIHELSHRMEDMNPQIGKMEAAYLRKRNTLEDGTQGALQGVTPGKRKEVGHPDNFTNPYVGRVYKDSGKFFEILSTGMEGTFGSAHGGLVGGGGRRADAGHRQFVLGLLATR